MDNKFIASILLKLATYGQVSFSQSDPRWKKAIKAYKDFCLDSGLEPRSIPIGTDGSVIEKIGLEEREDCANLW